MFTNLHSLEIHLISGLNRLIPIKTADDFTLLSDIGLYN